MFQNEKKDNRIKVSHINVIELGPGLVHVIISSTLSHYSFVSSVFY